MAKNNEEFQVKKNGEPLPEENGQKVIDESNYAIRAPQRSNAPLIGRGGDPLFRRIRATKEQLNELLEETSTVQDWVQRETCNNVAISCLNNANLKEAYYEIKDGFGDYGPILLMGFKTPQGVEIPRLKILDNEGNVVNIITGPFVIEEITKRAAAYRASQSNYEQIDTDEIGEVIADYQSSDLITEGEGVLQDYSGNPDDYT